ncbi:putative thioredoxin reductase-like protein 1 [Colletotrichum chlorophyti]|uniref:Putative thioredoxin reductase-like protein 1 n=1 Tax=Colletotrichum chlorophyti TaxID=708187 RepID=A0A1Q8RUF8_9PEZI|nr:putative thioredoxin reductase-like protein 1 [Colletotrichum chlorophyti]
MPALDVLIVGGGPGGLAVATGLARQLYTAVVFDSGVYRNARTKHMHNVPTWDHRDPADFRAKARSDILARYDTIKFHETKIESIRRMEDGQFEAKDAAGTLWTGKKVVLASGVRDVYPDIPGYDDVWGRGVYHCLFCDGFEDRGSDSAGVLAIGDIAKVPPALHLSRMAKRLAKKVVVYTNGASELSDQIVGALGQDPIITFDNRRVTRLEKVKDGSSETIVHFEDGTSVSHGFVVHKPKSQINGPFVEQLSLELNEMGVIKTNQPFYETSVQGVFAVGDCASPMPAVVNAVAMGAFAAGGLVAQLGAEPTEKI